MSTPTPAAVLPGTGEDDSQLRLLSIFHYVVAGLTALGSLFPVIHLVLGIAMLGGLADGADRAADRLFGLVFIAVALLLIVLGMAMAAALAWAGRNLARRRRHTACLVVAGLACMLVPFGTVLGVFTLVVLCRPAVKAQFAG